MRSLESEHLAPLLRIDALPLQSLRFLAPELSEPGYGYLPDQKLDS